MEIVNQPLAARSWQRGVALSQGVLVGCSPFPKRPGSRGLLAGKTSGNGGHQSVSPVEGALPCIQQSVPYTIFSALQTENLGIILHLSLYIPT